IQTILDIGTGAGFLAILCSKYDCDVTGIDISPEMIHQAQNLSQELNVHIQFKVMDAEGLNFADDSFDLVIARNVTW
ncbi:class I SAM-dependent methyltransferase, partial [Staphylococcus epidermidis]|uniref:class I SAM-dependent methyltransferase n=2 Tax=Staphylococcus TaxID=1279 RepID=UPI0030C356B7